MKKSLVRKSAGLLAFSALTVGLVGLAAPAAQAAPVNHSSLSRGQTLGYGSPVKELSRSMLNGLSETLKFSSTGDLTLTFSGHTVWTSGTRASKARLVLDGNGGLYIKSGSRVVRSFHTSGKGGTQAALSVYGNFGVYGKNAVWRSHSGTTFNREKAIAYNVLWLLNAERRAHHRAPVKMNSHLISSAHSHNLDMARHNTMSHQLPGEAYFADRMTRAGYHWSWAAENIAYNSDVSLKGTLMLEKLMYAEGPAPAGEDNHYENIVGSHYKDVGVDIYFDRAHGRVWLTTDLGAK